jgi:hypothetical protein
MASRAANCMRLKRCSPKVAPLVCANPRTKSSTASRDEPTSSTSVAGAKDRMNSAAAAIRSAADGDCSTRSMPAGNVTPPDAPSQTARPCHGSHFPPLDCGVVHLVIAGHMRNRGKVNVYTCLGRGFLPGPYGGTKAACTPATPRLSSEGASNPSRVSSRRSRGVRERVRPYLIGF